MGEYVLSSEMTSWSTSISTKWICQNCISQLETRSVCRVALAMRVKDKELNDFGNTWTIPHCFLIMSHWKNDFQMSLWNLPLRYPRRLDFMEGEIVLLGGKPAVAILTFASSCGYSTNIYGYFIYKWLILTISSSWNRWLFQFFWLPKHGWPILA